jgi:hypothetical protein
MQFALVFFEVFILGASSWVLSRGAKSISTRAEAALHIACALGGLAAFLGFWLQATRVSNDGFSAVTQAEAQDDFFSHISVSDDLDDDNAGTRAVERFTAARSAYAALVQRMLQIWTGLLAVAIAFWLYLRRAFVRLTIRWRKALAEAVADWDRDLWSPEDQAERETKQRLLTLVKEGCVTVCFLSLKGCSPQIATAHGGMVRRDADAVHVGPHHTCTGVRYEEIATPLEPFVAVFVVWAIPAIVMATGYVF